MKRLHNGLLAVMLCLSMPALAERSDRDRPVNIEADSVRMDDTKKSAIYEGHVVLSQGSLLISAQRIEIQQDDKGFSSGIASGAPAQFREKIEGKNEYVEGWANRIEYEGRAEKIRLFGQARLKRGIDELRGEVVVYEHGVGLFQARGDGGNAQGRVRAVIRPRDPSPQADAPSTKPASQAPKP